VFLAKRVTQCSFKCNSVILTSVTSTDVLETDTGETTAGPVPYPHQRLK